MALFPPTLGAAVAHNVLAALMLIALVTVLARSHRDKPAPAAGPPAETVGQNDKYRHGGRAT
jgi:hypothetical protein